MMYNLLLNHSLLLHTPELVLIDRILSLLSIIINYVFQALDVQYQVNGQRQGHTCS
jgi:hypothetical protein